MTNNIKIANNICPHCGKALKKKKTITSMAVMQSYGVILVHFIGGGLKTYKYTKKRHKHFLNIMIAESEYE